MVLSLHLGLHEAPSPAHGEAEDRPWTKPLERKYGGKFLYCKSPYYPNIDIYLCGTLHVAKTSSEMVKDVIHFIKPDYVVLELCEGRADNLIVSSPSDVNLTISEIMKHTFQTKSLKTLGVGLLAWMQLKAARLMGNQLGGELAVASREAVNIGAIAVLGDRLYGCTIQRIFDKLDWQEKCKMIIVLFWYVYLVTNFT